MRSVPHIAAGRKGAEIKQILIAFGTRPEAIKLATLIHALRSEPEHFRVHICVTGQHREMLDQTLGVFNLSPDRDLNLMHPNQSLAEITAGVLTGMTEALKEVEPDLLIVQGDTTTTLASALAAFYQSIPVAHLEAGLRTGTKGSPFPEELNRQFVSRIADLHFAPTESSRSNLVNEGVPEKGIFVTGNTVIDAMYWMIEQLASDPTFGQRVERELRRRLSFDYQVEQMVLVTGHRRENFGQGLAAVCSGLATLAERFPAVQFVYPVHLNPKVMGPVQKTLSNVPNIRLIAPLDYAHFIELLQYARVVVTDSGGIQEEAPSLGIPVVVTRFSTERPEAVAAGTVKVVGPLTEPLVATVSQLLCDDLYYAEMSNATNPYGDGHATSRIMSELNRL